MTIAEVQSLIDSISFVGGLKAWGAHVEARRAPNSARLDIILTYTVPDRDTGEPLTIHAVTVLYESSLLTMNAAQLVAFVHRELTNGFRHELNESFLIAGRRVVEPHADDQKRLRGAA